MADVPLEKFQGERVQVGVVHRRKTDRVCVLDGDIEALLHGAERWRRLNSSHKVARDVQEDAW